MPSTFPDQEFADRPEGRESREKRVQLIFARAPKQKIMRVCRDDLTALGRCPAYPPITSEFVRRTTDQRASCRLLHQKTNAGGLHYHQDLPPCLLAIESESAVFG